MTAAMVVAITVEVAREKNAFVGLHPIWIYVGFAIAGVLVIVAFLFPGKKTDTTLHTADIKDSFNPSNTLTANPTINVYPLERQREPQLRAETSQLPQRYPNLIFCRVWTERLFRINDNFCFHVFSGMENKFPMFSAIVAEIKNASSDWAVGCAKNIKSRIGV